MGRPYPDILVSWKDAAVLRDRRVTAGGAEGQLTFEASGGDPRGRALGGCDRRVWLRAWLVEGDGFGGGSLLAGRAHGDAALAGYLESPHRWEDALRAELAAAGADKDEGLLTSARAVMSVADAQGWQMGKYTVQVTGGQQDTGG